MAKPDEAAATPGDPYATSKTSLRDTIKWLAGIFGALAAVVIAGTPISGLGALWPRLQFWWAGLALLASFAIICIALIRLLNLLRADFLYLSDLETSSVGKFNHESLQEITQVRQEIDSHPRDLLPRGFNTIDAFLAHTEKLENDAEIAQRLWVGLHNKELQNESEIITAKSQYDHLLDVINAYRVYEQRIVAFASYCRLYNRVRRDMPFILGLGALSLLSLMVFSVLAKGPPEDKPPTIVIAPLDGDHKIADPIAEPTLQPVHFATGSAHIDDAGLTAIQRARDELLARPGSALLLTAYTDTVGTSTINDSLAKQRATAVQKMLCGPGGIARSRVFIAELPKNGLPIVTDDNQEKMHNRAVFMHLVNLTP